MTLEPGSITWRGNTAMSMSPSSMTLEPGSITWRGNTAMSPSMLRAWLHRLERKHGHVPQYDLRAWLHHLERKHGHMTLEPGSIAWRGNTAMSSSMTLEPGSIAWRGNTAMSSSMTLEPGSITWRGNITISEVPNNVNLNLSMVPLNSASSNLLKISVKGFTMEQVYWGLTPQQQPGFLVLVHIEAVMMMMKCQDLNSRSFPHATSIKLFIE